MSSCVAPSGGNRHGGLVAHLQRAFPLFPVRPDLQPAVGVDRCGGAQHHGLGAQVIGQLQAAVHNGQCEVVGPLHGLAAPQHQPLRGLSAQAQLEVVILQCLLALRHSIEALDVGPSIKGHHRIDLRTHSQEIHCLILLANGIFGMYLHNFHVALLNGLFNFGLFLLVAFFGTSAQFFGLELQVEQVRTAAAAALIAPLEQGEVEKPSGVIEAGSRHMHQLIALSNWDQHRALAVGASGSSDVSSGCERGLHRQQMRVPGGLWHTGAKNF
ncbi:hypothetical protein QTO34_000735 [Cnephaeus nilssonii]|uniref:Uncharacterized protein n=1 Tax=Cnephaeus nilssonii TaxID=3371016 RepID=A0AA40LUX8_CNENI|nr:hypothetical protein QTO34_000735 [Eptesicus nilssonii]